MKGHPLPRRGRRPGTVLVLLAAGAFLSAGAAPQPTHAQELRPFAPTCPGTAPFTSPPVTLPPPAVGQHRRPLPINLATALKLTHARAWDILIAAQRVQVAAAQFQNREVLWLPTLWNGVDWVHHDGGNQNVTTGAINDVSRSSFMVGTAPYAVFAVTEAIFEPLAQQQVLRARQADAQTAVNDTTLSAALTYFDVEEARGDLAGAADVVRRARELLRSIRTLAPDFVPNVEVARAESQVARLEQSERSARERWQVASAELVRILRMDPAAVVEPLEPPHLQVTLVSPQTPVDELLPVALTYRPELAAYQALIKAAIQRWREEQFRPLLPTILARGIGTQTPYPMAFGSFGGGQGDTLGHFGIRDDFDLQALWELRNLGFGNQALIRERKADRDVVEMQLHRTQDFVAREVAQAVAQVQSAADRVEEAERGLKASVSSANDNLKGVGQYKRVGGNIVGLVIRPQEAVAAVQDLIQAYYSYYGAVADYNRAQFRLYRALGNPAQALATDNGPCFSSGAAATQRAPLLGPPVADTDDANSGK
jgi:outer membrane protein TolC